LNGRIKATVAESSSKTLLFGDRFPFRYFTDEYGLEYYAAFPGCSAETEASFETVVYLAGKVDEKSLSTIYVIENSDGRVADAIRRNTSGKNQEIITLNSMQSVSDKDIAAGASYLGIMEENLKALMKGL
jgi:zinc transport system substrate-binding protein